MTLKSLATILVCLCFHLHCLSQDNASFVDRIANFPSKFLNSVNKEAASLGSKLDQQTEKYLQRLLKKEKKLIKKLQKSDSSAAQQLENAEKEYAQLNEQLRNAPFDSTGRNAPYFPYLDTLKTALNFLDRRGDVVTLPGNTHQEIDNSLHKLRSLQSSLRQTEQVKAFISQRRDYLKQMLQKNTRMPAGISKAFNQFNKEVYYYSQQVKEYKELLNNPDKLTRKGLDLLSRTNMFQNFIREHSELAGLFNMPSGYSAGQPMPGLQTSAQVRQLIQAQISGGGPNAMQVVQQNLQAAQQQVNTLKDKLNKLGGGGSSDMEMPDFTPNTQKTKSFLRRLEFGTNLQSIKSNSYFPSTTDLGLSIGYKLSDKSVIGIGGSYKVGWGKDIRHISITSQGAGLRSFLDVKIKGSFFASGGYEYNYQGFARPDSVGLDQGNAWTQSGLMGISKIISLKTKFFKKTKVQLLWDFLSYQQVPRTQALKFRVGYNF